MKQNNILSRAFAVALAVLTVVFFYPAQTLAASQTPPVLDTIYLENATAAVGGSLMVSVDAFAPSGQLDTIWVEFINPDTGVTASAYLGRNYARHIDGLYSGQLTGLAAGQYILRVAALTDSLGNRVRYYGREAFMPAGGFNTELWEEETAFTVLGDDAPPTVQSWRFSEKLEDDQRVVTVGVSARDDVSGVKGIQTVFEHTTTGKRVYLSLGKSNWVQHDDYEREWKVPDAVGGGTFRLVKYTVQDNAENKATFSVNPRKEEYPLTENISFRLSGDEMNDTAPPTLGGVAIKEQQRYDSKLRYRLEVQAGDDLSGMHHITLRFKNTAIDHTVSKVIKPEDHIGGNTYSAWLEVSTAMPSGSYRLDSAVVADNSGNVALYYATPPSSGGKERLLFASTPAFTVDTAYKTADKTPPALSAVTVSGDKVAAGQKVRVSASVSDDMTGVDSVRLVFENAEKTHRLYLTLKESGDAYAADLNTAGRRGVYRLARVLTADKAGNLMEYSATKGNLPWQPALTID